MKEVILALIKALKSVLLLAGIIIMLAILMIGCGVGALLF